MEKNPLRTIKDQLGESPLERKTSSSALKKQSLPEAKARHHQQKLPWF